MKEPVILEGDAIILPLASYVAKFTTESPGLVLTLGLASIEKILEKTVMETAFQCTLQKTIQNTEQILIPSLSMSVKQDQSHFNVKSEKP